jgi:hypothetical protein
MSGPAADAESTRDTGPTQEGIGARADDISAQEREEILAQIEKAVARARTPLGPGGLRYKSERSGAALPLIVNAAAVLVIAAGAAAFSWYFNRTEQSIVTRPAAIVSAGGEIVGAIKRESEQQLAGKDQEITRVQGELSKIDAQLSTLKADSVARIQQREQELRASLASELESARERLQKEGASTAAVERQVRALEERRGRELEAQLSAFRRQSEAELAAKETEINRLFAQNQRTLEEARADKAKLQAQLAAQREELLAKGQGDTAKLTEALGSLREQARREQLAVEQVAQSYRAADQAMRAGRWDEAVAALDAIPVYLDGPVVASLPAVQKRKPVDLFIVGSLKDLVAVRRGAGEESAAAAPAAIAEADRAAVRKAVGQAIADGDAAWTSGNYKAALDRYGRALEAMKDTSALLPRMGVRMAEAGWRQGQADLAAREDRAAKPLVDKADSLAKAGRWTEAVSAYASVLRAYPQTSLGPRAVDGVQSSVDGLLLSLGEQSSQKERELSGALKQAELRRLAAAEEKLKTVSDGLAASLRRAGSSTAVAQKELISLLEAKVKVKEVLGSESVEAQYPGLAAKLDRYIDLFGEEKRMEARASTLRDVGAVVDYLDAKKARDEVLPLLDRYATEAGRNAFQQMLDRLRGLFD